MAKESVRIGAEDSAPESSESVAVPAAAGASSAVVLPARFMPLSGVVRAGRGSQRYLTLARERCRLGVVGALGNSYAACPEERPRQQQGQPRHRARAVRPPRAPAALLEPSCPRPEAMQASTTPHVQMA